MASYGIGLALKIKTGWSLMNPLLIAIILVYLKSVGTGAVIVSKQQDRPYLKATVRTLEDNSVTVNYVAKNYRFPINDEKVPILDVS